MSGMSGWDVVRAAPIIFILVIVIRVFYMWFKRLFRNMSRYKMEGVIIGVLIGVTLFSYGGVK